LGGTRGAPLLGVELRGLGFVKESLKYRDEALWRLELRQMADPYRAVAQQSRKTSARGAHAAAVGESRSVS